MYHSGLGASQVASFIGCALAAAWLGLQLKMEQVMVSTLARLGAISGGRLGQRLAA